jgi:hypothetical protein
MTTTPHLVKPTTQVNTTDGGTDQLSAAITPLQDGGYVVVWRDDSRTYNPLGEEIVGQRYDAAGNKIGGEAALGGFTLHSNHDQFSPAAITLANGDVAVAFVDSFDGNGDIVVRIFDPSLNIVREDDIDLGPDQTVDPSLTALPDGGYVISYTLGDLPHTNAVTLTVSAAGVIRGLFDPTAPQLASHVATLSDGNVAAVYVNTVPGSTLDTNINFSIFSPAHGWVRGGFVPGGATLGSEN